MSFISKVREKCVCIFNYNSQSFCWWLCYYLYLKVIVNKVYTLYNCRRLLRITSEHICCKCNFIHSSQYWRWLKLICVGKSLCCMLLDDVYTPSHSHSFAFILNLNVHNSLTVYHTPFTGRKENVHSVRMRWNDILINYSTICASLNSQHQYFFSLQLRQTEWDGNKKFNFIFTTRNTQTLNRLRLKMKRKTHTNIELSFTFFLFLFKWNKRA